MKRYNVWLEHDKGADCHTITAASRDEAGERALAHAAAPNARVARIDGSDE